VRSEDFFELGEFLPNSMVKGIQPDYLDAPTDDSVPVVNTLSIQRLAIREEDCRHMTREDYDEIDPLRKLRKGDVLITMDGGVSIGKPVLFNRDGPFTADSHVCILRPIGLEPRSLVYLLASPMGQQQFRRAESGASGQTAVTEEDVRRFIFPSALLANLDSVVAGIEKEREIIAQERDKLAKREAAAWTQLERLIA
jgi:type I restriction enzyme S subunit